jgi:uncharacterized spore protein YtfJ
MGHGAGVGAVTTEGVDEMSESTSNDTDVLETIRRVVDGAGAGKVFGTPVAQDGVVVLPVAKVIGGGGGGGGTGPAVDGVEPRGSGGGVGVVARPVGVYVIEDGAVAWRPAVDVSRIILGGQIVAIVALLVIRALIKRRGGVSEQPGR